MQDILARCPIGAGARSSADTSTPSTWADDISYITAEVEIGPPVTPKHIAIYVRFGSLANIFPCPTDVRFVAKSGLIVDATSKESALSDK
jgi:hypothetical protein